MQCHKPVVNKHAAVTQERSEKFVSRLYWQDVNLHGRLYKKRAKDESVLRMWVYQPPEGARVPYSHILEHAKWTEIDKNAEYGPSWATYWFKVEISVPADWEGEEVHFLWDSGCEAAIWEHGVMQQGLTGGDGVDRRSEYILTRKAAKGEAFSFLIEMACNGMFGLGSGGMIMSPDPSRYFKIKTAEIAAFNRQAWDLMWDFVIISDMGKYLPPDESIRGAQAMWTANQIVNTCYPLDSSTYAEAQEIAARFLNTKNGESVHRISAVGHCHIDTAWLWPYAETRRKCGRSFATAIRYMEMPEYSDYKFVASQAQQHEWVKQDYPLLFEKMKAKASEGKFLPVGGTWVEMDCNIPSGESFVRQFLLGQRFFKKEYGEYSNVFWLPDTFGYSAQLPQIVQAAGIRFFLTQKLSWNLYNKFPHSTFLWEGIDGSKVLAHFPPADTYNAQCSVEEMAKSLKNFKDKDRSNVSILLFGHGDGGGGPQMEMLERLKRFKDCDGMPRVEYETPYDFFLKAEKDQDKLLTWIGELYFELHNGTYTSQARTKAGNRAGEVLLHDIEFLYTLVATSKNDWSSYPYEAILGLWKLLLLNQFHDVVPGSSIGMVYEDAEKYYAQIKEEGEKLREAALDVLTSQTSGSGKEEGSGAVLAVNTIDCPRTEVVELSAGSASSGQKAYNGNSLCIVSAPNLGSRVNDPAEQTPGAADAVTAYEQESGKEKAKEGEASGASYVLENKFVKAVFASTGHLLSLWDKRAQREVIDKSARAPGNNFIKLDDVPFFWDAWDTFIYSYQKTHEVYYRSSVEIIEKGPVRAMLLLKVDLDSEGKNTLAQRISLTSLSPRLDFDTEVEWHENRRFLKVEFPLNIRAPRATYEIQFGHATRPTHSNTSWDMAQFEVCGHKWADLSEYDYGVALLNNCKYGYSCQDNVMRLSLLRSPKEPDPQCDMGHHHFRYALYPHEDSLQHAGVVQEGMRFNSPLHARALPGAVSKTEHGAVFSVDHRSVVIDTIKKAEDSNDIIVRLYEAYGGRRQVKFKTTMPVKQVRVCNGLELDIDGDAVLSYSAEDGAVLSFTPFKIVTLKLVMA